MFSSIKRGVKDGQETPCSLLKVFWIFVFVFSILQAAAARLMLLSSPHCLSNNLFPPHK